MGTPAFEAFAQAYIKAYRYKTVTSDEFRSTLLRCYPDPNPPPFVSFLLTFTCLPPRIYIYIMLGSCFLFPAYGT